jgi:hypothetical protein
MRRGKAKPAENQIAGFDRRPERGNHNKNLD